MFIWLKTNKKKVIPFLLVAFLAAFFVIYYFQTSSISSSLGSSNSDNQSAITNSTDGKEPVSQSRQSDNPFNHRGSLTEVDVQNYIHWMSHQKVKADEKWTHYKLTPERVEWLLAEVKVRDYNHEDIYLEILSKWKKGNFDRADQDHNRIWSLQKGTIGKATGVLTPEEEKEYLEKIGRELN
ncbi:DUF6241 domain-containing protein [Sutcliffiella deserti]|uniref:DUF6241 domain-containing protein n=1 Tax=Sutcliffiella deserti TaxID=2875501 RepID=UPI001CBD2C10|nr:DUF6241 domain-containing protein [Sutcliffiella deserti]